VRKAIAAGRLDERRLENYRKLQRESARHTASLAETRRSEREFAKQVRQVMALKRKRGEPD
jgi:ribosome biogenesis GTPase